MCSGNIAKGQDSVKVEECSWEDRGKHAKDSLCVGG